MANELERIIFQSAKKTVTTVDIDGVVESIEPYTAKVTGEDEAGEVIPILQKGVLGQRVLILSDGRRRYALPILDPTVEKLEIIVEDVAEAKADAEDAQTTAGLAALTAEATQGRVDAVEDAVDAAVDRIDDAQAAADTAATEAGQALAGMSQALHVANLAEAAAQGIVKVQQSDPGHYPGRIWYQTNASGQGIGVKVSKSGSWVPYMLLADQVLVPSSVGSVLIADGAITAPKLHVDALNFKTATGMELTSSTVTGSLIRTSDSFPRVEMDTYGLRAYNASGSTTFNLTGSTGSITGFAISGGTVTGATVRTAASGARVEMAGGVLSGYASTNRPTIQLDAAYNHLGSIEPALVFRKNLSSNWVPMIMREDGITFLNSTGTWYGKFEGDGSNLKIQNSAYSGNLYISTSITGTGSIHMDSNSAIYQYSRWQEFTIAGATSGYNTWTIRPISISGAVRAVLQFTGGGANMPQTTIAANVLIDANGNFYRTSSARRFKNDIRDIGADPNRVLDVPVRDWVDATIAMDDDSYKTRTPGVVAEEVEDVGLDQFVTYDEDGQTAGVLYDRLPLLLIPVVRDLRDRITALEEQHG